jgi:Sigma-70 region 2
VSDQTISPHDATELIELYSPHYRSLVRLAAMLVRDTPTAEEVVQNAFVAMHAGWHRLKDTDKALAYLRALPAGAAAAAGRPRSGGQRPSDRCGAGARHAGRLRLSRPAGVSRGIRPGLYQGRRSGVCRGVSRMAVLAIAAICYLGVLPLFVT